MVAQVTGKVNGAELIFRRNGAGRWETAAPAPPGGVYIIELWATDEAGNQTYFATVKVTFDTSRLCARVEALDVGAGWSVESVKSLFSLSPVNVGTRETSVESAVYLSESVYFQIIKCEVCGPCNATKTY